MSFEPGNITKEHILQAVKQIEASQVELRNSTKFDVIINGKAYPPKEIMRYAHELANGSYLWDNSGGEPTNKYLKKFGFEIVEKQNDPVKELIRAYKTKIRVHGNYEEKYKWQLCRKFNDVWKSDEPFKDKVYKFQFANLLYYNAVVVLKEVVDHYPDAVGLLFIELFDDEVALQSRIDKFRNDFQSLYAKIYNKPLATHQDERTLSTYLTFFSPEEYTFYKDSFYRKFCGLLGVRIEKHGKKYAHYLDLVNSFKQEYIDGDEELLELKRGFLDETCDPDNNNLILAQDILYQTLDKGMLNRRKYWRVGTTVGENAEMSKLQSMLDGGYISIGWPEIGDLNVQDKISRSVIQSLLQDEGYYSGDNRTASKKAGEILTFYESIRIGDIILAQEGQKVNAIGEVLDDYEFIDDDIFPHIHRVEWKVFSPDLINQEGLRTTVYQLTDESVIEKVTRLLSQMPEEVKKDKINNVDMSLNTILYGPPGTGKTYHSIYHALSIIEGKSIEELKAEEYKKIKDRFDKLLIKDFEQVPQSGRIGFVTFHQSMSYEEFIEGIKPKLDDESDSNILYAIKPGVFKYISTIAKVGSLSVGNPSFEKSYSEFLDFVRNEPGAKFVLNTLKREKPFTVYINSNHNIRFHANTEKAYEGSIRKEFIKAYLETGIAPDWQSYTSAIGEFIREKFNYSNVAVNNTEEKEPYVLIIDEINRGNVSQIFGELITLIEDNKREGQNEELGVILPYSKEFFTVPDNLFIIGTMNTADRSVEALDSALRRRFTFIHMEPKPEELKNQVISGINLTNLLSVINDRISYLLDNDHKIGHSYFLNINDDKDLRNTFGNKIIPLLKEYFYNDYEKIYWILVSDFVKKPDNDNKIFNVPEARVDSEGIYIIKEITDDFPIIEALKTTIDV